MRRKKRCSNGQKDMHTNRAGHSILTKNNSQRLSGGWYGTRKSSDDRIVPAVSGAGMRRRIWQLNAPVYIIKMRSPMTDTAIAISILNRPDFFPYIFLPLFHERTTVLL